MSEDYSIRRAKKACDTCRKRKAKCDTKLPTCTTCARLNRECKYSQSSGIRKQPRTWDVDERFRRIDHQSTDGRPVSNDSSGHNNGHSQPSEEELWSLLNKDFDHIIDKFPEDSVLANGKSGSLPSEGVHDALSREEMVRYAWHYLDKFHNQPLGIFIPKVLMESVENGTCSQEVCYAMAAIAERFTVPDPPQQRYNIEYFNKAWKLVLRSIEVGSVTISTFQALFMLADCQFTEGQPHYAGQKFSIGMALAHGEGLFDELCNESFSELEKELRRRISWCFYVAHHIFFPGRDSQLDVKFGVSLKLPRDDYKATEILNEQPVLNDERTIPASMQGSLIRILVIWGKVNQILLSKGEFPTEDFKPWQNQSTTSWVRSLLDDFEAYNPVGTRSEHAPTYHTNTDRDFGFSSTTSPWLYMRIVYHGIFCLIYHPFLLSSHTRNYPSYPRSWLESCLSTAQSHAEVITNILDQMTKEGLDISSPFLAYIVGISATVHMYFSRVNVNDTTHHYSGVKSALEYISKVSSRWKNAQNVLLHLRFLWKRSSSWSNWLKHSSSESDPNDSNRMLDHTAIWKSMDYISLSTNVFSLFLNGSNLDLFVSGSTPKPDTAL
ncbi:hypothetical protein TRICI_005280 [Trichomonascus ciferrii]|uniref:Zn(2)-C6 fungal-type domain-containing protein n=1 Tax=Trichomonascus ciferrii TaxID=44093 RepID=A0A642UU34_9ASCO|nr:hypothetical protein TRICI_005280 [Trichomonascus ciferrii]